MLSGSGAEVKGTPGTSWVVNSLSNRSAPNPDRSENCDGETEPAINNAAASEFTALGALHRETGETVENESSNYNQFQSISFTKVLRRVTRGIIISCKYIL